MKNYLKYLVFLALVLSIQIALAQFPDINAPMRVPITVSINNFKEIMKQLNTPTTKYQANTFKVAFSSTYAKGRGNAGGCGFAATSLKIRIVATDNTTSNTFAVEYLFALENQRTVYVSYNNLKEFVTVSERNGTYYLDTKTIHFVFTPNKISCGMPPPPPPPVTATVVNRIEQTNAGVAYKIYLQEPASNTNRKGIILLGSGNNERDPSTGDLNGGLENMTCAELAKLGYIAAVVAYRDQPALASNWSNWNSNGEMLATDMSNVANTLISKYGSAYGIGRSKVITGGVSYTSFALFSNIAVSTTLADTKGLLAVCGATELWQAQNFKIPIFNLVCAGNPEGQLSGQALYNAITNPSIKAQSTGITDASCTTHCGGNTASWAALMINQVKLWIP